MSSVQAEVVDQAFETWVRLVSGWCEKEAGVDIESIDDADLATMYADGFTPRRAAKKALRDAGF